MSSSAWPRCLLLDDPALVATGLALSYSAAYLIGLPVSFARLRRKLPDLDAEVLVRHCVRLLLAVAPAAIAAWLISWAFMSQFGSKLALALGLAVAGVVAVGLFLVMARLMRIHEVGEIVANLRRRGDDSNPETLEAREEAVIEASGDQFADFRSSGDSPTVIRPPSPSIEGAGEEGARAMVQATAAQGVDESGEGLPAATLPAGTVLASRYRLEELIGESQPTVTWRAFDQVLSRSVLVHLLAPGDPGEDELLTAARKASVATDSRFLRVLDAVHSSDPAVGSYIVCEYATGQSLEMILSHGPLTGLEAAWITREVADALAGVHGLGLYHRRISPETVIITPSGNIKIVGLLIEAALRRPRVMWCTAPTPQSWLTSRIWADCCMPLLCAAGRAARRSACPMLRRWGGAG